MASENILLRGISTTPTDRNTQDGGCSESLNVCLKDGELAAIQKPVDVTQAEIGAGTTNSVVPIYIHETSGYRHYIGKNSSNQVGYIQNGGSFTSFFTDSNPITAITSMGNTLIVSTDSDIHYVLWKDNQYKYLGTRIPEPDIELYTRGPYSHETAFSIDSNDSAGSLTSVAIGGWIASTPTEIASKYNENIYPQREANSDYKDFVTACTSALAAHIATLNTKNRAYGFFTHPVLARYAVRLYDGSYINLSQPIYLDHNTVVNLDWALNTTARGYVELVASGTGGRDVTIKSRIEVCPYKILYKIHAWNGISDWKDIVSGIDIFLSTSIQMPRLNTEPVRAVYRSNNGSAWPANQTSMYFDLCLGDNPSYSNSYSYPQSPTRDYILQEILNKSLFYRAVSRGLYFSSTSEEMIRPLSDDDLATKPILDESNTNDILTSAVHLSVLNNRLLAAAASFYSLPGYRYLNAIAPLENMPEGQSFDCKVFYKIQEDDGFHWVVAQNSEWDKAEYARRLLMYPNSKCERAYIYIKQDTERQPSFRVVTMKPHPLLNCAYWYDGLDRRISTLLHVPVEEPTPNPVHKIGDNKILLSEVGNPFVFPVACRVTVDATKIIGVSQATLDLSINLSEAYSLYAFTDKGIFAAALNSAGTISSLKFVCGDIALNGSLCVIDRGIVYITNRGVMIIQGQQIECISDNMIGRHFHLDSTDDAALIDILTTAGCNSAALTSAVQFSKFMENAKCIYDYKGARLIFVSTSTGCGGYGYVFMLTTETWHKADNTAALLDYIPNCYPKALGYKSGDSKIYDFSTNLSPDSNTLTEKGVIITRPLSLGATDIYKSIDALFLRGDFAKGNVKYLVLASNDGTNFHLLSSIKGPSWRYYRIVLVSSMTANERLAFVEAHTTEKFTNKPR